MANIRNRLFPNRSMEEETELGLQPRSEAENDRVNGTQNGTIQRRALRDLADAFIELDHTCLLGIQDLEKQSFFKQVNQTLTSVLPNEIIDVGQRLEQLSAIRAGDLESRVKYLTDPNDTMTKYWQVAKYLIIKGLGILDRNGEYRSTYWRESEATKSMIWSIDTAACETEQYIVKALRAKQLNHATQEALRMRWSYLDLIHHEFSGGNRDTRRKSSSWQTFLDASRQRRNQTTGTIDILMWSTFFVTVGIAIPTTALGWQYSTHKPGTSIDADFWFLIQSCSMTLLSLLTMALPLWKGEDLPGKTARIGLHVFMGAGAVSAFIAPILYLFIPTEWSALLNIFAGAVQAFATLRLALAREGMTTPSQKTKEE